MGYIDMHLVGRGKTNNKTFTSLTCSNRSIDRGLIEVWEEDVLTVYKGLVNLSEIYL